MTYDFFSLIPFYTASSRFQERENLKPAWECFLISEKAGSVLRSECSYHERARGPIHARAKCVAHCCTCTCMTQTGCTLRTSQIKPGDLLASENYKLRASLGCVDLRGSSTFEGYLKGTITKKIGFCWPAVSDLLYSLRAWCISHDFRGGVLKEIRKGGEEVIASIRTQQLTVDANDCPGSSARVHPPAPSTLRVQLRHEAWSTRRPRAQKISTLYVICIVCKFCCDYSAGKLLESDHESSRGDSKEARMEKRTIVPSARLWCRGYLSEQSKQKRYTLEGTFKKRMVDALACRVKLKNTSSVTFTVKHLEQTTMSTVWNWSYAKCSLLRSGTPRFEDGIISTKKSWRRRTFIQRQSQSTWHKTKLLAN